jgi:hypothetical protein
MTLKPADLDEQIRAGEIGCIVQYTVRPFTHEQGEKNMKVHTRVVGSKDSFKHICKS